MRNNIAGYLIRNPFIKYALAFNDDVFGLKTKLEFESELIKDMQQMANLFDRPVKLNKSFLKQIEPAAIASLNLKKGKYIMPNYEESSIKVMTAEEYIKSTNKLEEQGHYSQLM